MLEKLKRRRIAVSLDRDELVLRPGDKVPAELLPEVRQYKAEILAHLRREERVGDGQAPPEDRPQATEQELRRLVDYLDDPLNFSRWLENLMQQTDSAEMGSDA